MGTALLALCCYALSLVLALFVGISPISDKAKIRFMYVGAAPSLIAVPMRAISHKVNHKLPQKVSCKTPQFIVLNIHKHSFLLAYPTEYH